MSAQSTAGVIAAYNHQEYIAEAVASLADQVDEVVVVNDFSTDETRGVLDGLTYENLIVIHNERQLGVSRAYNVGIGATRADVILIQGGDDRSLPARAARQTAVLADRSVSLTYSLPMVINGAGLRLPEAVAGEFLAGAEEIGALEQLYFHANYVCAPAVAVRREDYLRHGGFRPGLDLLQDYDLWLTLAETGRFAVTDEPVVEYRKHASNLSREYVGFDSPRRRRYAAERDFVLDRFVTHARRSTLERLAIAGGIEGRRVNTLDDRELRALLRLVHPEQMVVRRGLAAVFELCGEPDFEARMAKMGLALGDITEFASRADHGGLAGMGQALAAADAIERLSRAQHDEGRANGD